MTKICVIGDSHVGALKQGWEKVKHDFPEFSLTFFASRGKLLTHLKVEQGKLQTDRPHIRKHLKQTSGGLDHVDPESFDVFLVYGLEMQAYLPFNYVSKNVLLALQQDTLLNTLGWTMVNRLRTLTDKPLFLGHTPMSASDLAPSVPDELYLQGVEYLNSNLLREVAATLQPQPKNTIVTGCQTERRFTL